MPVVAKTQEELILGAIEKQGFMYTTQLAALAKIRVEGAAWIQALKAIQAQVDRGVLLARKPPEMNIWHIDVDAGFKWLENYQPRGDSNDSISKDEPGNEGCDIPQENGIQRAL